MSGALWRTAIVSWPQPPSRSCTEPHRVYRGPACAVTDDVFAADIPQNRAAIAARRIVDRDMVCSVIEGTEVNAT